MTRGSGEWPKFANGKAYPYMVWGGTFNRASKAVLDNPDNRVRGLSVVAIGRIEKSEIARISYGVMLPKIELIETFDRVSELLVKNGDAAKPEWSGEFDEPFEELKKRTRQDDAGLVVVAFGQNGDDAETASFGTASGVVSAHALTTAGEMLLK